jgi:hypothetical protein
MPPGFGTVEREVGTVIGVGSSDDSRIKTVRTNMYPYFQAPVWKSSSKGSGRFISIILNRIQNKQNYSARSPLAGLHQRA